MGIEKNRKKAKTIADFEFLIFVYLHRHAHASCRYHVIID